MDINQTLENIDSLSFDEKISVLNEIKKTLHQVSPVDDPVDMVLWIKSDLIKANDYNPNRVAPPEMKLLAISIKEDGYTQPIVTYYDSEQELYVVVDGFHRSRVGKEILEIRKRLNEYLPIVVIEKEIGDRMASTIRHNRARGTHNVDLMSNIVAELHQMGKSDNWIAKHLGMDADEVLRLKQITGIADLFKDRSFSQSWEICDGVNNE
jgi:ParB-like chromosome segregation protein Spo0J